MHKLKRVSLAALLLCATAGVALAQSPVRIGELKCAVTETDKKLMETILTLNCAFFGNEGKNLGSYRGTVDRKGISLGSIGTEQIIWIVATAGDPANAKLDGTYLGAEAGVSAGAGVGANYLVGGGNKRISMQPYSVEGKKGFGVALGAQSLKLEEIPASE